MNISSLNQLVHIFHKITDPRDPVADRTAPSLADRELACAL